jgi:hypothetical protein
MAGDDLVAKSLREKCVNEDVRRMIGDIEDLGEIWDMLDTCNKRQEKYMPEALKLIIKFRGYKISDSVAIRDFDSLLRATIKGTQMAERLKLPINN